MSFIWDYSSRQIINRQNSLKLRNYKYGLIIGCGGIGSWIALDCALCGHFETIIVFDNDEIETSNLNRTPFRVIDIGTQKVKAIHELIIERRPKQNLLCVNERFNFQRLIELISDVNENSTVVFDCRDDIYEDLNEFKSTIKIWKLGYDGLELTIDGNPRKHHVFGQAQGYTTVPSFLYPSQLIANLVVGHVLICNTEAFKDNDLIDRDGMFKEVVTFDSGSLLYDIIYCKIIKEHVKFQIKQEKKQGEIKDEESNQQSVLPSNPDKDIRKCSTTEANV